MIVFIHELPNRDQVLGTASLGSELWNHTTSLHITLCIQNVVLLTKYDG